MTQHQYITALPVRMATNAELQLDYGVASVDLVLKAWRMLDPLDFERWLANPRTFDWKHWEARQKRKGRTVA